MWGEWLRRWVVHGFVVLLSEVAGYEGSGVTHLLINYISLAVEHIISASFAA